MQYSLSAIVIAAAAAAAAAAPPPPRPVMIPPVGPHARLCLSLAQVTGLTPGRDNFLSVRAAPAAAARELDRLGPDREVLICGFSRDRRWAGIVYGPELEQGCVQPPPGRAPVRYAGPCRSGWAAARYLATFGD